MTSRATAAAVLAALTLLTACAGEPVPEPTVEQQRAELSARPDLDTAVTELQAVLDEVRARLEEELGIDGWSEFGGPSPAGCALEFPEVGFDFGTSSVGSWGSAAPFLDADWPAVLAIITEVTAASGFGPPDVLVARPTQYQVYVRGPYGAELSIGSGSVAATTGGYTGCHPLTP